jgi:pyruvate/oxaloacetate carboxyltransferase
MGEVVQKGGFGTSVTPVSQFYFQQAFNNTMFGPWKKIAEGYGKMVLGYFGKTPVAPDAEVVKIAQEQLGMDPTDRLVVDINDENPNLGVEAAKPSCSATTASRTTAKRTSSSPRPVRTKASPTSKARPLWASARMPPP